MTIPSPPEMTQGTRRAVARFSTFEFDVRAGELRKAGVRVALQEHSRRLLICLLQRPNELVTRDELRAQLWPEDTFVDFEHGLNTAMRRLREALGDAAGTPQFIETLPRRGYRFIMPVVWDGEAGRLGPGPRYRLPVWALVAVVAAAVAAGWFTWNLAQSGRPWPATTYLQADIAPNGRLLGANDLERQDAIGFGRPSRTAIALSPDGRLLAYSARHEDRQQIHLRAFARPDAQAITGSDGGEAPFFSPDGSWLGFWVGRTLKKVATNGGPVVDVAVIPNGSPVGSSWGSDGTIVFGLADGGLCEVSGAGGVPQPLTSLAKGEISHRLPHVLPGAAGTLFTVVRQPFSWSDAAIDVLTRRTGERKRLVEGAVDARYLASGHVAYVRDGLVFVAPFDPVRLELTGSPVGVLDDVMHAIHGQNRQLDTGAAQISFSDTGTVAYVSGGAYPHPTSTVVWVDRRGRPTPLALPTRNYLAARLSPDGTRVALMVRSPAADIDIWMYDLQRGTFTRMTFGGFNSYPVWTPDGQRLVFSRTVAGLPTLHWMPADGSGTPEPIAEGGEPQFASDWTPDGRTLAYVQGQSPASRAIWRTWQQGGRWGKAPVVQSSSGSTDPALSPDGRWLAFVSDESGRAQVFVQPFPGPGARQQVSISGGIEPFWSRDGRTLFYLTHPAAAGALRVMTGVTVTATATGGLALGAPVPLFSSPYMSTTPVRANDAAPDGRLLMILPDEASAPPVTDVMIVINWFEELRRLAPAAGLRSP